MSLIQGNADPHLTGPEAPYILVALQEVARMNRLLSYMRQTLDELLKGLNGQLSMTQAMEDLGRALAANQVPGRNPADEWSWERLAWPSLKALAPWFVDLNARVDGLREWTSEFQTPVSVWISNLFNPTAFLTAVMQVTARQQAKALDSMAIETHVTEHLTLDQLPDKRPEHGAFVHGLFIQGARWDPEATPTQALDDVVCSGAIAESRIKELLPAIPILYVKPVPVDPAWEASSVGFLRKDENTYNCPVYMTTQRGPTYVFLSTLHTTEPPSKWVIAGVALVMQASD